MKAVDERMQTFPLAVGLFMGALAAPDIKKYLNDRQVTDEEIEAAYNAVMVIARAFYREPQT